ncbi:MAG: hypothetical protein ACR2OC_10230 [Solirubrobacterales bacterium]
MTDAIAFYCVADKRYFLGAVGLVNSLRLLGHEEPIYLLDLGLAPWQRRAIEGEVVLVADPGATPPHLSKTIAPLAHPAETAVLIDTDMIATRSLAPLIAAVAGGGVIAFRDRQQRYFAEWGSELDLGEARPIPYVSSGLVVLGGPERAQVLGLMADRQRRVDYSRTFWRDNDRDYPFLYADQAVLNAILATRVEAESFTAYEARLASTPPFRKLRLLDETALRCAYPDGAEPHVLHQFVRKPWLEPMYHGIYSRLLARCLLAGDVPVRVPDEEVPLRMRSGSRARLDRSFVNARDLGRFYLGDVLPGWIGNRLEDRRRRGAARS